MGETLVLTRRDVRDLLSLDDCILAVDDAFRLHAEGKSLAPGVLGVAFLDPKSRVANRKRTGHQALFLIGTERLTGPEHRRG